MMRFFAELKRRNVIKVAAAYVIVSWLLLQVSDTLVPALHLPAWFHSGVAFLLIIGFPIAMIFAWAFEMTPEGLRKEKEVDKTQSITQVTGQKLNYTIMALMAAALAYFAYDKFMVSPEIQPELAQSTANVEPTVNIEPSEAQKANRKSIAVIPFQNRSANEENAEFFSAGVHDELLTNLSKIGDLKVISRTSVMSYRDTTKNIQQIASELGVANILEGGVQRAGDKVRINVQLIDAATDEHIWAEIYDRELSAENIFAIQAEIAQAIANELEATLSPREQELLAILPTSNLEVVDNWMIANQLINRGNWQGIRDAQSYVQKAIDLEPEFAQGHILLALTYFNLFETGATSLEDIREPWKQAIQTALSLDESNAAAYAAQALFLWKNDMEGTDETFKRARQLEPNNAEIMVMYGQYLRKTFHPEQALPLYQMAKELDPLSINVLYGLARIHESRGELNESLEIYSKIRQIDPSSQVGYGPVAGIYMLIGNIAQSVNWIFKGLVVDPNDIDLYNWVVRGYIDLGDYSSAHQWLVWIEENSNNHPMTLAGWAMLNIYEGNSTAAIPYIKQALEDQLPNRWGSDSILYKALLIWALDQGETESALNLAKKSQPNLFIQNPMINADNVLPAIDSSRLLQAENYHDEAERLLQAVIATYEKPNAVIEPWNTSGKAQALALLGKNKDALDELRLLVDNNWRLFWRWHTELNPNFESLREEPEFKTIVEILRSDMSQQYALVKAMEASGEIPLPPGEGQR